MQAKTFLGTILFATAAGVTLGILLSSSKGAKVRKSITDKTEDIQDGLRHSIRNHTKKFDHLADALESRIDDVKSKVDKLSDRLQSKLS